MNMVKRIAFRVHGGVQGVSFRYFTRKQATSYNLTGFVFNSPQGHGYYVEGEVQGEDHGVQKLLKDLDRGPSAARVEKVDKNEIEVRDGEKGFEVRHG